MLRAGAQGVGCGVLTLLLGQPQALEFAKLYGSRLSYVQSYRLPCSLLQCALARLARIPRPRAAVGSVSPLLTTKPLPPLDLSSFHGCAQAPPPSVRTNQLPDTDSYSAACCSTTPVRPGLATATGSLRWPSLRLRCTATTLVSHHHDSRDG